MKRNLAMPILALFIFCAAPTSAQQNPALYPHETMNNWGRWGDDDERGTTNFITPASIVEAAKLIQKGKTFSLAIPIERNGPIFPSRNPAHHFMSSTGTDPLIVGEGAPGDVAFTDDYIYMALQGSTQWDALAHAFYNGKFYNGYPLDIVTVTGAAKLGIDKVKDSFVGRAVLIDVLRYKGGSLTPGYGITRADIEGALEAQGSEIKRGDIAIIRTGEVPRFYTMPVTEQPQWSATQTGIVKDVIPWIKESEIAAIAVDNVGVEQAPNPDGKDWNLHGNLLRDLGVFLGEIWWLEELAEDCAADGRYEFFISAPPLNIPGAVGSVINPLAVQ